MKGKLYIQRKRDGTQIEKPEGKKVDLYLDKDGNAQSFADDRLVAEITNARISFISANGINLIGVEDPIRNRTKMFYQEWWFVPEAQT